MAVQAEMVSAKGVGVTSVVAMEEGVADSVAAEDSAAVAAVEVEDSVASEALAVRSALAEHCPQTVYNLDGTVVTYRMRCIESRTNCHAAQLH